MTFEEINRMIEEIGYPSCYYAFPEEDPNNPNPPYLLFYYPNRNDFVADDKQYAKKTALNIELYTNNKDFEAEEAVERVLEAHDIVYSKEEDFIEAEKLYEVLYFMEVFING